MKDFKKVGEWTYKVDRAGTEHDGTYLCMAKNDKETAKDEVKIIISKFRGYSKSMSLKKSKFLTPSPQVILSHHSH